MKGPRCPKTGGNHPDHFDDLGNLLDRHSHVLLPSPFNLAVRGAGQSEMDYIWVNFCPVGKRRNKQSNRRRGLAPTSAMIMGGHSGERPAGETIRRDPGLAARL